ncbi:MAG TPA: HAMP domain-containing protein [Herpetosiphonaceae bacterium]
MFAQLRTRLWMSSLATVAVVIGLLAFMLLIQVRFNERVHHISNLKDAANDARELALYTQYMVHDNDAYALGHREHRAEFEGHVTTIAALYTRLQQAIDSGVLDPTEQMHIDQMRALHEQYGRAARQLFDAADTNLAQPSEANQATQDAAWERADQVGSQLSEETHELAHRIDAKLEGAASIISARHSQVLIAMGIFGAIVITLLVVIQGMAGRSVGVPLRRLMAGVHEYTAGNLDVRIDSKSRNEIGALARAFNQMAGSLQEQRRALEQRNHELQQSLHTQQQLFSTVQDLAAPLLPIGHQIVLLAIVGHVDPQRADALLQTLLQGVAQQRASCAILDVTGIALMDTEVLRLLLQMIEATELLGAQVLVAGISSSMAKVIVAQNIDVRRLRPYRDLGSAIEAAQALRADLASGGVLASR